MPTGFESWLAAREPALHRIATLLAIDPYAGHELLGRALTRVHGVWSRIDTDHAEDRVLRLLVEEHRATWDGTRAGARPFLTGAPHDDPGEIAWELFTVLAPRARAVLVLRLHLGLSPTEAGDLLRTSVTGVRDDEAAALARLRNHLVELRSRRSDTSPVADPERLLTEVLLERADATAYIASDPTDLRAAAARLRARRRRRTGLGAAAMVAFVAVTIRALGPGDPAPARQEPARTLTGPLESFEPGGQPQVPYLIGDTFVGIDGGQRELPVPHPRSATPFRDHLWVTDLYFTDTDTLRRIDATGRQVEEWPTSGDPVLGDDGRSFAWVEVRGSDDDSNLIHRGRATQRVSGPVWLVGIIGRQVIFNGTQSGGVWITDLQTPPRAIPGLAIARDVDPRTGAVAGTAGNGDGVVVDAGTGVARWRSPAWRPEAFSPDGRHVVAFSTSGDRVEHAILGARRGRWDAFINRYGPGPGVLDLRWEDDAHVLMLVTAQGESSILRADLSGSITSATPSLPGDVVGGSTYQFAVR